MSWVGAEAERRMAAEPTGSTSGGHRFPGERSTLVASARAKVAVDHLAAAAGYEPLVRSAQRDLALACPSG